MLPCVISTNSIISLHVVACLSLPSILEDDILPMGLLPMHSLFADSLVLEINLTPKIELFEFEVTESISVGFTHTLEFVILKSFQILKLYLLMGIIFQM